MRVKVLYFAVLRERRGASSETLDLPAGGDVAMALATIAKSNPLVAPLLPRAQVAVNQVVVPATTLLGDGDELALIPPVSGGSGSRVAVLDRALAPGAVADMVTGPERGGLVTFTGLVRKHGKIPNVVRLEYEAYREMAERVLGDIVSEIEGEIPGARLAIHHRVGSLQVGEAAVIVAASAPHRGPAFDACRAAIDRLKSRAPIWKKEVGETGAEWIEHCC
ncbi:MAG TPA: molybdenum cofactor biosynthesis protein MoaE [Polyangia bacterium]